MREATGRGITNVLLWRRGNILLGTILFSSFLVYAGTPNFVNCCFHARPLVGAVSSMVELHRTFLLKEQFN